MEQKDGKSLQANNIGKAGNAIGIAITVYTDPLCCWTWAMQPQWKKLLADLEGRMPVALKYKMGGLLPSWQHFNDSVNSIRKPVQMGPEWMHARALSGVPINDRIWITDPPTSSYPACIAVKCVELLTPQLVSEFFQVLQEAVMAKNLNIAKMDVLLECASALQMQYPAFDPEKFKETLFGEEGKEAFRKDLQECKYLNITRMPTIVFRLTNRRPILLHGYQTHESLKDTCSNLGV